MASKAGMGSLKESKRKELESHLGRLYGYAYSLCNDRDDAKDLVQDCAAKALAAHNPPCDPSAYRAWLFTILRNTFLDRRRSHEVRADYESQQPKMQDSGEYWIADERLINVITVRMELSRLPDPHREIIGLVDIAGLSYAETAQALGIPTGTVMSRISRARAALIEAIFEGNVRMLQPKRRR